MTGSTNRIRVPGYAQRVFYNDNIEYRNFSPDLAGLQLTTSGGTALFTMGNFAVTTNYEPKIDKIFTTSNFSNFTTLTDLNTTLEASLELLLNNAAVELNLDKTDLSNYALFGSLTEFVRVSLENIIINWPAALFVTPIFYVQPANTPTSGLTVENYSFNALSGQSSFKVNVNVLQNNYQINYLSTGNLVGTFNSDNPLRDLKTSYLSYSIFYNNVEYDILAFTGSTNTINDYIYLVVEGDPFSGITSGYTPYYIKPNAVEENLFFNSISTFESYLLNRYSDPKYTASFKYSVKSDGGAILYITDSVTWPTSDGYNIDFDTVDFVNYATRLSGISTNYDLTTSGLMTRFLVSDSITDFDTTMTHVDPIDQDTSDQKVLKTLNIYGRQFDERNNFIKNISFAHNVSYNKADETPDVYLKDLARNMGWDLISSVLELDLLKNYVLPNTSTYSGHSIGLTAQQADSELWRKLILNTPWLWKSKGTRKAVEFLFKFIGTPLGLISFNEYVYVAENKLDMDIFASALALNGANTDLTTYPVNSNGYPSPLLNTADLYFQSNGLWYRETGGAQASIDITAGNNPHVGPYDGGFKYINQFRSLIPNFSAVTISSQTLTTSTVNLFNNYNSGTMTDYHGDTYVDITNDDGVDFSSCLIVTSTIVEDPKHRQDETNCGCVIPSERKSLSVCLNRKFPDQNCLSEIANANFDPTYGNYVFDFNQYNLDGTIYKNNGNPVYYTSPFVNVECCNFLGGITYHYNQLDTNGDLYNSGYICCKTNNSCGCLTSCGWTLDPQKFVVNPTDNQKYLLFDTELGDQTVTSLDGCNCVAAFTIPVDIIDPITGNQGVGCQLTALGLQDLTSPNSVIINTYALRSTGQIECSAIGCIVDLTVESTGSVNGLPTGTISITPADGIGPYNYVWTNGITTTSATTISASTYTITGLTNGTYNITVTDAETCSGKVAVVIPLTLCTMALTATAQGSTGTDGMIALSVGGNVGSYTISWFSVASNNVKTPLSQTSRNLSGLTAGVYEAVVTDTACSKVLDVTVPVLNCSYLTLDIQTADHTATANASGGGPYTYLWSNAATTQTITNVPNGSYTVTVTDTSTGCQIQGTVDVTYVVSLFWVAQPSTDNGALQPFAILYYSVDGGATLQQASTINRSITQYVTLNANIKAGQSLSFYLTNKPITDPTFYYVRFGASFSPDFNFGIDNYCGVLTPYQITLNVSRSIYLNLPTQPSTLTAGQDVFLTC